MTRTRAAAAVALALAGGSLLPSVATGATAPDALTLTVTSKTDRALRARGITVQATGVAARAGRRFTLPATSTTTTALRAAGALRLKTRERSVTLGAPRLELGARPRVTAVLGGRRVTVLTLTVAPLKTATGFSLEATGANLSATAAKTIQRRLRVTKVPREAFVTVAAAGTFAAPPSTPATPAAGPCTLNTAAGTPPVPGSAEPPVKTRPAGARTITSATLTWRVRESFIRYIASGEGTTSSRGAAGAPAEALEGAPPLVYSYRFPFAEGWCDPATGAARITFSGTVAFRYAAHGIDLVANDPEVELDGPASRVIFRMTGSGDTAGGNRRQVVETLDVSKALTSGGGTTFSYERVPGAVPPGAASSVFAGYYLPGEPFGWLSISFTTD
ncbi:Htaa protein [Solirubrobacter pauli]|uniref:Htaa protein n=1 Tax=Solirubrobacter pauli TaxID=166793 RepID=A0A660LEN7_9ACTN|nr:HtaA domain-containing protein [Solirubrobacter pauli]RKQ92675.1 Htaa protein [Solirubrobacter pauli]